MQQAHLDYGSTLIAEGKMVQNGPLLDGGFLRGVSVLRADSLDEAQRLADGDPAVQSGRLVCDVHSWMVQVVILPE